MNALLDAALGYAARGIPVYPVHWPRPAPGGASPGCSCRRGAACDRPAKHPLVRHGIHDATTNPAQLERWWQRWPQANLGLATGIVFDALDIDGPAGLAALRQLARHGGPAAPRPAGGHGGRWLAPLVHPDRAGQPPTPRPRPRRLARHRRVRARPTQPPRLRRAATAGCATSTRRPCPRSRLPCAPCSTPTAQPQPGQRTRPSRPTRPAAGPGHPYGRRVLADELAALGRATPGHRNRTLNRCAFKVYRYVAGGLLDDQEVTLAFTTTALAIGLDRGRGRPHPRLGPHGRPGQPPHRPGRTRPEHRGGRVMTGRWTYRVSAAGVLLLAAAAFTLSYDALHQLALDSRVRPALAWLWPVVIDGTIVVALLTVLAAKRAAATGRLPVGAGRAVLPGLGRLQHRPRPRPAGRPTGVRHGPGRPGPHHPPAHAAGRLATAEARPHRPRGRTPGRPRTRTPAHGRATSPHPSWPRADRGAQVGARARVRAAYEAQVAAGQTPTGAGLARAAGVSERYGQRLLAEFTADPARAGHPNGDRPTGDRPAHRDSHEHAERR